MTNETTNEIATGPAPSGPTSEAKASAPAGDDRPFTIVVGERAVELRPGFHTGHAVELVARRKTYDIGVGLREHQVVDLALALYRALGDAGRQAFEGKLAREMQPGEQSTFPLDEQAEVAFVNANGRSVRISVPTTPGPFDALLGAAMPRPGGLRRVIVGLRSREVKRLRDGLDEALERAEKRQRPKEEPPQATSATPPRTERVASFMRGPR